MSKFRNKRIYIVVALLLCAASVSASFAIFSSWKTAENNLYVGHNEIEIEEEFEPPSELKQDTQFKKEVKVRNTGNVPCYVRVFADFSDSEVRDVAEFSADGETFMSVGDYQAAIRERGWAYDPDTGYYYYTVPVQPGDATPVLFHSVQVHFERESDIREFRIIVSAESIQTADEDGVEIDDYAAAW